MLDNVERLPSTQRRETLPADLTRALLPDCDAPWREAAVDDPAKLSMTGRVDEDDGFEPRLEPQRIQPCPYDHAQHFEDVSPAKVLPALRNNRVEETGRREHARRGQDVRDVLVPRDAEHAGLCRPLHRRFIAEAFVYRERVRHVGAAHGFEVDAQQGLLDGT
ncbi:MAG: hypothetical protein JRJ10_09745 [Deltaproteobacteria bacterium]|nr:hypothetical protein [Deltaproteobacteria bacterium]MBW2222746.1 hypothetical protein [Deltaproteobacteria bacterium]MBW2402895.1 hypothetical protein [Deltaproteobacteria bacterium]MBW2545926.1 hypothetical protein [Deltaproteobacteria bacterium]MBW2717281.1 hypothetical protein [Deltaproteobacteria bacterium]